MVRTVTTKTKISKKASEPEQEVESEPEQVSDTENVEADSGSESENEDSQENAIDSLLNGIIEMCNMQQKITQRILTDVKKTQKEIARERKEHEKDIKKSKGRKKREGGGAPQKPSVVKTADFRKFIESNWNKLNDKDGNPILTELTHADDGSLTISRQKAQHLVSAYVKAQNLQKDTSDKRIITLDKTLQKLFKDYDQSKNEKKDDDGNVTQKAGFYFTSIMEAIKPHFAD